MFDQEHDAEARLSFAGRLDESMDALRYYLDKLNEVCPSGEMSDIRAAYERLREYMAEYVALLSL